MKTAFPIAGLIFLYCSPSPADKIDLSKTRSSLSLVNGSAISSPIADDYNPQLIHKEDGTLILLFASNRACSPCTATNYHLFVASSVSPYYPNPYSVGVIPPFNPAVVVNNGGTEITLGTSRANFSMSYAQGGLYIILEYGGQISAASITAANVAAADTLGTPVPLANAARISDKLIAVDFKEFTMLTLSGGSVLKSAMNSVDAGIIQTNAKLSSAGNAAVAHYAYSGYSDSLFYPDTGGLSSGRYGAHGDAHFFFNYALDSAGLSLGYVSVFRAPLSVNNGYWHSNDLLLFSAGASPDSHDLYLVNSHTAEELIELDGSPSPTAPVSMPFLPATNYAPFRIFMTSTATTGALGGVGGADALCNSDFAGMPDQNVHYKALIADGVWRSPPGSLFIDWVLEPMAQYIRADTGASIQTADATGVFSFPIGAVTGTAGNAWTGLTNAWLDGVNTCNPGMGAWMDMSALSNGDVGTATATTNAVINNATPVACNTAAKLYCVEQPFDY